MKKVVLGIIVAMFALSLISAVDITLSKAVYYPGETLQAEMSGNFIDNPSLANVGIYASGVVHPSASESGLIKSGNKYLFYSVLPLTPGNYSMKLANTRYYQNNVQTDTPIIENFTVVSANESYLSFSPGAISATKDFSITIKSYNSDQQVNVEFAATGQKETFELGEGQQKTVDFPISGISSFTQSTITINSYTIQAIISPSSQPSTNQSTINIPIRDFVALSTGDIEETLLPNKDYSFKITVINTLDQPVYGIDISPTNNAIRLDTDRIDELNQEAILNVTINTPNSFNDSIYLTYGNSSLAIPVKIIVTQQASNVTYNPAIVNPEKTCAGNNGNKCDILKGQECLGTQISASDGICCIGSCSSGPTSSAWLWGIVILLILGAGGWLLYQRQKKAPKGSKMSEVLHKKTEEYKERMMPEQHKAPEVKKSLTKV